MELDERRIGRPTSGAAVAAQWFAQDLFNDAALSDQEEEDIPVPVTAKKQKLGNAKQAAKANARSAAMAPVVSLQQPEAEAAPEAIAAAAAAAVRPVTDDSAASSSAEDSDSSLQSESSSSDDEDGQLPFAGPSTEADDRPNASGFEEVPVSRQHADGSSDESSDDGFDDLDDDGRAEVLALARKMLKGRDRQDIMDNAYHRYAFHETDLPRWFEEDEKRHMK